MTDIVYKKGIDNIVADSLSSKKQQLEAGESPTFNGVIPAQQHCSIFTPSLELKNLVSYSHLQTDGHQRLLLK